MWMFDSRTTVKKVRNSLTWFSHYVDDLLLCSDSNEVEKLVEDTIGAVVPLKETGRIQTAEKGGGSLVFIGRHIFHDGQTSLESTAS